MSETLLSHYRILGELGRGGMGVLYKAVDVRLDRPVAIKVLRPDRSLSEERRQRFRREAKAASALNHPNIVTIYEVERGHLDGEDRDCIVMEWIDGQSLDQLLSAGRLDFDRAVDLATGIAEALSAAHAAGIVHRDLKPANVMVTTRGDAKLVDFGLAKLVEASSDAETKASDLYTTEGAVLGTAAYMSPEQAAGNPIDPRSDIFSFGTVLYEMLAGVKPFKGDSQITTRMAVLTQTPTPVRTLRPDVPARLSRVVDRCLDKRPEVRYSSGAALAAELRNLRAAGRTSFRLPGRVVGAIGAAVVVLVAGGAWYAYDASRVRWARYEALPQIEQLGEQDKFVEAYDLLQRARPLIEQDAAFQRLWDKFTSPLRVSSEPPAAAVYWAPFDAPQAPWTVADPTPTEVRVPARVMLRLRVEKEGFEPTEIARYPGTVSVVLDPKGAAPVGMVRVPAGQVTVDGTQVAIGEFWLDKFEVTNQRYKAFVDAGGYRDPKYWKHSFRTAAGDLTFAETMKLFVDRTGQPGPPGWELSAFPAGEAEHPVRGVSWFEAAAFAEFEGKSLPTSWHWLAATDVFSPVAVMDLSNYDSVGPAAVGANKGLGPYGTYDMAGNVREWAWNETLGKRSSMGGGWNDPTYAYRSRYAYDPFDRSETNGVRLARFLEPPAPQLLAPIERTWRAYDQERPVDDVTFAAYARLYDYDATPLGATTTARDSGTPDWTLERVEYAAGYGTERLTADVYLPTRARPPFHAVVYFPGSGAQGATRQNGGQTGLIDFIVKSGRAVVYPTYKSTFERSLKAVPPMTSQGHRDLVIEITKEVRRTVDYLRSRPDIDARRIAYYGYSWGAREGLNVTALESRFAASILLAGGLDRPRIAPEVDQLNFAPRVRVPTLMLNGREDFRFPYEESQLPMFRLLGSREKSHVLIKSGHGAPRLEIIKPILDWLEKYLGPVTMN